MLDTQCIDISKNDTIVLNNPTNGDFQMKLVFDDNWMNICIKDMAID